MKLSNRILVFPILLIAAVLLSSFDNGNDKISLQLSGKLVYQNYGEKNLVWIFFSDKGPEAISKLSAPESFLTKESIRRRLKRINSVSKFDERDIPVYGNYINELTAAGIQIRHVSKWFNAVSCYADKMQISEISGMQSVKKIDIVQRYIKSNFETENNPEENSGNPGYNSPTTMNYGQSLDQANVINVPPVHDEGVSGDGILIAVFDAGFDNLGHSCFNNIRSKGLHTYDFVNGDTIVSDGTGRMGSGWHGTITLSLICGYDPGFLVSPAFNSGFILAKTENSDSETPLEEDNWIAAAEWADSLGAEIISSSLGYLAFDPPYPSYTWQSMDGNTAMITKAADIAVGKGIIVVISSGNDGSNSSHNTLNAPADGDSVITVGAVRSNRLRAGYSSVGPTVDGRIKPEVMAMGTNNFTARFGSGSSGYINSSSGTSLACPMVAAVCALMLSVNPDLTPVEVKEILKSTASNSNVPNNLIGWGVVDAFLAVQKAQNEKALYPEDYTLLQNYPNPFNPSTTIVFKLNKSGNVSLVIYDVRGKEIDRIVDNKFYERGNIQLNYSNPGLSSGVYFYSMLVNGEVIDSKKMILVY
ncbi:MAG TPA: S8 family serine peptidase [Ignavibacteria bacterium]|nr:S8 family serine peptidase [Ignavibacteria bacterium]